MFITFDLFFKEGKGYEDLITLIKSNPKKYTFLVNKIDKIDKRLRKSRNYGWTMLKHRNERFEGYVKIFKHDGECFCNINDNSGYGALTGAWLSWLVSNAYELIYGVDIRLRNQVLIT